MIELLALPTMDPVPRVQVHVSGIPSGAATLSVWRSSRSGVSEVRSAVETAATDPFTVTDYAAPWNEDTTYWATFADVNGAPLAESERASVHLVFFGTVMHQPLDPSRAVAVETMVATARTVTHRQLGEHVHAGGSGLPIWIGVGELGASTHLRFRLRTETDRARARSMFGSRAEPLPPVLCLRSSLPLHLPQPYFFLAAETEWEAWDHASGGQATMLSWDVTETSEPGLGLLVSPFSYEDIESAYGSYEDLEGDPLNSTYEALEQRQDLASLA